MSTEIQDEWERLSGDQLRNLDIAAGSIRVFDSESRRWRRFKFPSVYRQLIRQAYEMGRKDRLPYQ